MEMEVTGVIAGNAKRFREQRKLTLDAAAALTGVSILFMIRKKWL